MQHYHGLPAFFTAELVQIVKSLEASSQITDPCAILSWLVNMTYNCVDLGFEDNSFEAQEDSSIAGKFNLDS